MLAYPSALSIAGLLCTQRFTSSRISSLTLMTLGTAILHPGVTAALIIGTIGGTNAVVAAVWRNRSDYLKLFLPVAALVCVACGATGLFAHQVWEVGYPDWGLTWSYIIPRILDLENQGAVVSGYGTVSLAIVTIGCFFIWFLLMAISFRNSEIAIAFLIGPAVLLILLRIAGADAATFQLIGMFYPATLCGAALLVDAWRKHMRVVFAVVLALALCNVAARVPRFIGASDRYAIEAFPDRIFSAKTLHEVSRLPAAHRYPLTRRIITPRFCCADSRI